MDTLKLLNILEKNARAEVKDLSDILNESEDVINSTLKELENKNIIRGYHTVINWDSTNKDQAMAIIEVKASPERDIGYDKVAKNIYRYPEVESCYLMSGSCEFIVIINGKTMKEVANFVGQKLAPIDGVTGTTTHFVLKCYKVEGVVLEVEENTNERMIITP